LMWGLLYFYAKFGAEATGIEGSWKGKRGFTTEAQRPQRRHRELIARKPPCCLRALCASVG